MQTIEKPYTLSIKTLLSLLDTSADGLSQTSAANRLSQYGANKLAVKKSTPWFIRLLSQCHNLLIYILTAAVGLTLILRKWADATVISAVIVIDAIIGFIQEQKAHNALLSVQKMLTFNANVLRDGKKTTVPAEVLVPGDVVLLEPGDKVPADLRLLEVKHLSLNEALLTGESEPVIKTSQVISGDAALHQQSNMAFFGTLVNRGYGKGLVVSTGKKTQIGQIQKLLGAVQPPTSPLLLRMNQFGRNLGFIVLVLVLAISLWGIFTYHYRLSDTIMTGIGIAVSLIPEGLPVMLTIALAVGVRRMARKHAIIRHLPAVETLGSVTVICTDKTGTLTQNEMVVRSIYLGEEGKITVTGWGYLPQGAFSYSGQPLSSNKNFTLEALCKAAVLCNDARLQQSASGSYELQGDPTEGALLTLAMKAGLDPDRCHTQYPRLDSMPFESESQFMATLHSDEEKDYNIIYFKGAPEIIIPWCTQEQTAGSPSSLDEEKWADHVFSLTSQGERTLALAYKKIPKNHQLLGEEDLRSNLTLLGIVGFIDPPRPEALKAIRECQAAGIAIKMITGDHPTTAQAIAVQMGITTSSRKVLTGHDIESMSFQELLDAVSTTQVFARMSPKHKLRLVEALQTRHELVAMTGDGVNDAPALKRANIGVAMGLKGSDAAKEAAAMVLTDDNFATIVDAVKEGRTVLQNLKKVILFLLPINGGESISLVVASLFGYTLPITPIQILWINMVSSLTLTMSLAFAPAETDHMKTPPQSSKLMSRVLWWRIALISCLFLAGIMGIFIWSLHQGVSLQTARTLSVNTLVALEISYLWSIRYEGNFSLKKEARMGVFLMIGISLLALSLQGALIYTPWLQTIFQTVPLSWKQLGYIAGIGVLSFLLVETDEWVFRQWRKTRKKTKAI